MNSHSDRLLRYRWLVRVLVWITLAACNYDPQPAGSSADGPGTTPSPATCPWVTQANHLDPCTQTPGGAVVFAAGSYTLDTTDGTVSPPTVTLVHYEEAGMRVVNAAAFTIESGATVRVIGSLPLFVLSHSTLVIAGELDASSKRTGGAQVIGPGARETNATAGQGGSDAGGGGGGGFGGEGGQGGNGNGGSNNGGMRGPASVPPVIVVGGHAGAEGGTAGGRGRGGAGGGAVQLTAHASIMVSGTVDAGGAGGQGSTSGDSGGGGGGSGGYLGFDAPQIAWTASAVVVANGGGGGTGCDGGDGPEGDNGGRTTQQAEGGAGTGCSVARAGGRGGAVVKNGGSGTSSGDGGGGGGGAAGFLLHFGPLTNQGAVASPDPTSR